MHSRALRALIPSLALALPAYAHVGHSAPSGSSFDPNAPKIVSDATAAAIDLQTAEVDFGQVESVIRLVGVVQPLPDRVQSVSPRLPGVVRAIHVRIGDTVRKGDPIADVDSPDSLRMVTDLAAAIARAEQAAALLESAREREALARADADRVEANAQAVAQNVLSERRARAIEARADLRRIETDLAQANRDADTLRRLIETLGATDDGVLRLTAAIDGAVVAQPAIVGQGVAAGESLARIVDLASVQVEGEAPESLLSSLAASPGAAVRVRPAPGQPVIATGTVRFISPVIDPAKRTARLIIDADNPGASLRQGQYLDLAVVLGVNETAVVVPPSAIVKEGPLQYVFVKERGAFLKRDVATGLRDDQRVEITLGLVPGDIVATSGAYSLSQLRGVAPPAPSDSHAH